MSDLTKASYDKIKYSLVARLVPVGEILRDGGWEDCKIIDFICRQKKQCVQEYYKIGTEAELIGTVLALRGLKGKADSSMESGFGKLFLRVFEKGLTAE